MAEYEGKPLFRWAYWGLSDDLYNGISNSFYEAKNLDIRDNASGVSISKTFQDISAGQITEQINKILKIDSTRMMAFWNTGQVYIYVAGTWNKVVKHDTWVLDADIFQDYVYWTTHWFIYKYALASVKSYGSWTISPTTVSALVDSTYHPLQSTYNVLAVGNWYNLSIVDLFGVFSTKMVFDTNTTVKIITELWGTLRLYCTRNFDKDVVYLWDSVKTTPDQVIPLEWYFVYQAFVFKGVDYVITNKGIWYIDWYKRVTLKRTTELTQNINAICVHKERLYIGWTGWVYVFWAKNKDYPDVLNLEYYTSNKWEFDQVYGMTSDWTNCYVAWANGAGTAFGIDKLSDIYYWTSGYLITRWFYANSLAEIKWGIYIRVGFKPLYVNQSITISYSINGWTYTALSPITYSSDKKTSWTTHQRVNWQFQYITFKIELVWITTSPIEFYTLDFYYDTMLD